MKDDIKLFLEYGIYNNTLYYPNTFKTTKQYISFLTPILKKLKFENKKNLLNFVNKNELNIYSTSIVISILGLNKDTYILISDKIVEHKSMLIFLWTYAAINGNNKNMYLNKLLLDKTNLIEKNIPEIFEVYKPSYNTCIKINRRLKDKYKVKYLIESQEHLNDILPIIKKLDIKPLDIYVEMGFTFSLKVKNSIVEYFINDKDNNLIDMIYYIDRWYLDEIPITIINLLEKELHITNDILIMYRMFVLNTSLNHKSLSNIIENYISKLGHTDKSFKVNINYVPNMNSTTKWDGLHTYSAHAASIISVINQCYLAHVNVKDKQIEHVDSLELYKGLLNNTSFSLDKCNPIVKNETISILFSNEIIDGYDVLWNVIEDTCPLYENIHYLKIVGKNKYLLQSFFNYINSNCCNKVIDESKKKYDDKKEEDIEDKETNTSTIKFKIDKL